MWPVAALSRCVCRSVVAAAPLFCTGRQAGSLTSATVGVSTPGTRADTARPTDGRMTSGAWLSLALVVAGRRPGLQPSRPRSTREEEGRGTAKVRRQP